MDLIRRLSKSTPLRYLIIGGTSFSIELSCLFAMHYLLDFSLPLATSIAYWIGFLLAFGLQKVVAFRDKRHKFHILTWQALLFGLLSIFNWGFTVFFISLFPASLLIVSRPLAQAIFAIWNYFLYKYVIFNDATAKNEA